MRFVKNPMTRRRILRFKEMKRAYISLWVLVILYLLSLGSELICNDVPLYVKFQGKSYFPVIKFYPEDVFVGNGKQTRPDYFRVRSDSRFKDNEQNFMLFAPIPYGPFQSLDPDRIPVSDYVAVAFKPLPIVGTVNIRKDLSIARAFRLGSFVGLDDKDLVDKNITEFFSVPPSLKAAIETRFQGLAAPSLAVSTTGPGDLPVRASLSTYRQRTRIPTTVRITFREDQAAVSQSQAQAFDIIFDRNLALNREQMTSQADAIWRTLPKAEQAIIQASVQNRYQGPVDSLTMVIGERKYRANFIKEDVRFPFRPIKGHLMGIDGAGRDVLSRILYGLRTSMSFGLLLVVGSMILGIVAGALQGYYGGLLDISGQRFIEIWSALPFLYIMILMGSIYGRSFSLLLFCYGLFNWIGISYYMRAEFLRLRKQPFVEAAKCMGAPAYKIIFKHILPNGMVPVITFFPFSLVGAIGSLAALDYLGFGLPPPTPSWGELLYQAQQYRWAWWLILYPSLALFIVMLLGVFVGEGVRNAYDPKRYTRLE
jgi:microcin C transport system permease protein